MKNLKELKKLIEKMTKENGEGKTLEIVTNLHKNNLIPKKVWTELKPWLNRKFFGM